jgi:type IV pilus assembly protein PilF
MKQAWLVLLSTATWLGNVAAADVEHRDNLARIHTELSGAYFSRGQYGVALDEIKAAHEANADYAPAYSVEGLIYMDLREFDKSDQAFQRALRLNPTDPDANHNYGWFLCNRRDKYIESLRYFLAAVKNPLYTTPQKSLQQAGLCAMSGGDTRAAEDYLRQADRVEPDNSQTLLALAQLAYGRGEYTAARTLLGREGHASAPTAASLWLNARVERKLGHDDAAASFSRQLQSHFPDSEEARRLAKGQFD